MAPGQERPLFLGQNSGEEVIVDSFMDELVKIGQSGRVLGKILRVMDQPGKARQVERAGKEVSEKLHKILMYEPPQPKAFKGKHIPGYKTIARTMADNPETLPTLAAPPGAGAWAVGVPAYVTFKTVFEGHLDKILRRRRRAKIKRYAIRGAAMAVPVASFEAGRQFGHQQRSQK